MRKCRIEGCDKKHLSGGYCQMHYMRIRRKGSHGGAKPSRNKAGDGCVTWNGYRRTTINGVEKPEHVWVAENSLGKELPIGAIVHHIDGDRLNNNTNNLVICPNQAYHMLLHVRQRALESCGDPDKRKCKFCDIYDKVGSLYTHPNGNQYYHRACAAKRWREKYGAGKENNTSNFA